MPPDAPEHFFVAGGLMFAALVGLLAAAVARRLHDRGFSGYWGLMPLPFVAYCSSKMLLLNSQFETGQPDMRLVFSISASFLLYSAVIWLVVLLARRSALGPNRFG